MARLMHVVTGVNVEVADEKVERMGSEWKPAEAKKAPAKKAAPARKSSK